MDEAEQDEVEVERVRVVDAIERWVKGTGAFVLGRARSVSDPRARDAFVADLIAGPVAAVLHDLGYVIVDPPAEP